MRVCDKCQVPKPLFRTLKDMRDSTEYDLCDDCYTILSDWMHNTERTGENDPVEQKPKRRK